MGPTQTMERGWLVRVEHGGFLPIRAGYQNAKVLQSLLSAGLAFRMVLSNSYTVCMCTEQ